MSINEDGNPILNKYSNYVSNHLFSAELGSAGRTNGARQIEKSREKRKKGGLRYKVTTVPSGLTGTETHFSQIGQT